MEVHAMAGITVRLVRGVPVAALPCRLDAVNAGLLEAALRHWLSCGFATLVVDLSQTQLCDPAGFAALLRAHKAASAEGGEVRVVASTATARVLSIAGNSRALRYFASLTEAVAETPMVAIQPHGPSLRQSTFWQRERPACA
jgi:anti-anti-sigma factor